MDIASEKKILRARLKALRSSLEINEYRSLNMSIMARCIELDEFTRAGTVHIYVSSVNNEADTLGIIYHLFDLGKRVVVPRCIPEQHLIQHIQIESLNELKRSHYGIMEPEYSPGREIRLEEIDLVIVPLLAFDRRGGRLGFGGGYYDRFLNGCSCPKAGLAYSFQEMDHIPLEQNDCALNIIITEKEIIRVR
jgi:5-formyltetrahydrofolate cyclo-ligase